MYTSLANINQTNATVHLSVVYRFPPTHCCRVVYYNARYFPIYWHLPLLSWNSLSYIADVLARKVSELTLDQYNTLYYHITATYYVNMFVTSGIGPNFFYWQELIYCWDNCAMLYKSNFRSRVRGTSLKRTLKR